MVGMITPKFAEAVVVAAVVAAAAVAAVAVAAVAAAAGAVVAAVVFALVDAAAAAVGVCLKTHLHLQMWERANVAALQWKKVWALELLRFEGEK